MKVKCEKFKGSKKMKKSNLSVNSKMNSNFWAKLKALFALPKWAKIFLGVLSVVAVAGLLGAFALQSWAKDKIQHGEFVLNGTDKGWQERLESGFAYDSRLYFEKADFLLRSKVIAYIDIRDISWVSPIDKNAVSELKSQNRHIKFSTSQNLSEFNGQKLGVVEYKMDFSPLAKTAIKYYFVLTICLIGVCVFFNSLKIYPWQNEILPLTKKDYIFLAFAFLLCAGICAFSFWLGFPGYHIIGDTYNSIALGKSNAHPVLIAYILQGLYLIFGKNLYYLFLFNLIPFYLGLFFLIAGFYLRFKNPFALVLIFPTFIGNIYFQNFVQYHSFALPMMLLCLYSLLLFLILVPFWQNPQNKVQKIAAKILWIFLFVLMFFAILWRHNAIFSVFPAFFVIIYLFLEKRNFKPQTFVKTYFKFVALSAVLCLAVVIIVPKILQVGKSYPANHPFLHQIAGACVPANDSSCFKDEWYYPHKTFSDVKALYEKYPLNADPFNVTWAYDDERPFKHEKLQGLKTQWIKSIAKHPLNFLTHEARFFKAMWFQNPAWMFDTKKMQEKATHESHISVVSDFKESQRSIAFTPLQEKIYSFLFHHKIVFNHAWGVSVGFIILVLSSVILWKKRKDIFANVSQNNALLVFCFSASFASFWSAFFIAVFSPVPESRYMSPILPMSIVALVSFVAFWFDYLARKKVD